MQMHFELSEEQRLFPRRRRRLRAAAARRGRTGAGHADHYPGMSRALAEQGLLGIAFAEADGGQGGTLMHAVLAIQKIALACPKSADIVQAGNFGPIRTFVEYASAEQKAALPARPAGWRS